MSEWSMEVHIPRGAQQVSMGPGLKFSAIAGGSKESMVLRERPEGRGTAGGEDGGAQGFECLQQSNI